MKDYRLNHVPWYDGKADKICCLECNEWFDSVSGHLKVHKMSVAEYKHKHNILPNTPLKNKKMLQKSREIASMLRLQGKFKTWRKGETSIPEKWRKGNTRQFYSSNQELHNLLGSSQKGKKKSAEHIEKMRQNAIKQNAIKNIQPYSFKKGQTPHNKIGGTCTVEGCNRPFVAKGLCSLHWQRAKKAKQNA